MDPLANTPWSTASTVEGFSKGQPNRVLIDYAARVLAGRPDARALDIGCGAGRNAVPLAALGWKVVGLDLSRPMLEAAAARAEREGVPGRIALIMAPMDFLPLADSSADLIVAHGIWNLARSSGEMLRAIAEAARVARPGAALFVFTFSMNTLAPDATPLAGESFVFTQFSGEPQCFLTEEQLLAAMSAAGFVRDPAVPLTEYNRPSPNSLRTIGGPVIYEAAFRRATGAV
jgi:ubiquinone/menaquinone biosynthesis C-methylase UbiE